MRHHYPRGAEAPINPFMCGEILHAFNLLGLSESPTSVQIWDAAQQFTLFFASYCRERQLPPDATAIIFGVTQPCDSHEQAALLGARNLVEAYKHFASNGEAAS